MSVDKSFFVDKLLEKKIYPPVFECTDQIETELYDIYVNKCIAGRVCYPVFKTYLEEIEYLIFTYNDFSVEKIDWRDNLKTSKCYDQIMEKVKRNMLEEGCKLTEDVLTYLVKYNDTELLNFIIENKFALFTKFTTKDIFAHCGRNFVCVLGDIFRIDTYCGCESLFLLFTFIFSIPGSGLSFNEYIQKSRYLRPINVWIAIDCYYESPEYSAEIYAAISTVEVYIPTSNKLTKNLFSLYCDLKDKHSSFKPIHIDIYKMVWIVADKPDLINEFIVRGYFSLD